MFGLCLSAAKQQPFATAVAPIDTYVQHKPAVSNHQGIAAVLETPCLVSASVLQTRLTAAFCHYSGTY